MYRVILTKGTEREPEFLPVYQALITERDFDPAEKFEWYRGEEDLPMSDERLEEIRNEQDILFAALDMNRNGA